MFVSLIKTENGWEKKEQTYSELYGNTTDPIDYDQCMALVDQDENFHFVDEEQHCRRLRSFHYRLDVWTSFTKPGSRNMRGILFDRDTKQLLALPFFKFFNLGQNNMSATSVFSKFKIDQVMEKVDGSLIYFYMLDNALCLRTKKTFDNVQCAIARQILSKNGILEGFIRDILVSGCTPMFELLSPRNRIVVKYDFEDLCFLGYRDMKTGKIVSANKIVTPPGVRKAADFSDQYQNLTSISSECDTRLFERDELTEGFVVYFSNGEMVKIKRKQYFDLAKLKESIYNDRAIVKLLFDEKLDDIRQEFEDDQYARNYIDMVVLSVADTWLKSVDTANKFWQQNKDLERKDYAILAKEQFKASNSLIFPMVMEYYSSVGKSDFGRLKESYIANRKWRESSHFKKNEEIEIV